MKEGWVSRWMDDLLGTLSFLPISELLENIECPGLSFLYPEGITKCPAQMIGP